MIVLKKELKVVLFPVLAILFIPLLISIINLFKLEIPVAAYLIIIILIAFITGFLVGMQTKEKGYLKGLLTGLIMIVIMFLISLLLGSKYSLYTFVYYLIIIISTTLGSMLGVNKTPKK